MNMFNWIAVGGSLVVLAGFWAIIRTFKQREMTLRKALEKLQQEFDLKASKINVVVRALPNLQAILAAAKSSDGWKTLFLDEVRSALRADSTSYWRINDREQCFELELSRGVRRGTETSKVPFDTALSDGVQKRTPFLLPDGAIGVPLVVEGSYNDVNFGRFQVKLLLQLFKRFSKRHFALFKCPNDGPKARQDDQGAMF